MYEIDELLNEQREADDIRKTVDKRTLVCFCVDSSISMSLDNRMETINREIEMFLDKKNKNGIDLDVCLVTFGNGAKVQCPFGALSRANEQKWTIEPTASRSDLGAGVLKALECLKARKEKVASYDVYSTSSLLIITCGDITDKSRCNDEAIPEVQRLIKAGDFKVKVLGEVSEKDTKILQRFMVNGDQVEHIDCLGDVDIYDIFSRSASEESKQRIEREGKW